MQNFLIISDYSDIKGGAAKVAIDTAIGLAQTNNKVFFLAGDSKPNEKLVAHKNIQCINLELPDLLSKRKLSLILSGLYNKKIKKPFDAMLEKIDIQNTTILVHSWTKILSPYIFKLLQKTNSHFYITAHDYFLVCPNGGLFNYRKNTICPLSKRKGIKCLLCNCDSRNYLIKVWRYMRQIIQNRLLKKCDYSLFTISDFSSKFLPKLKDNKTLKNPIDFYDVPIKYDNSKGFILAYIGRISKEKGVNIFCDALIKTNYTGYIFGDGPELVSLKKKYESYKNIIFFGWMKKEELISYLKYVKALVFPSIWYEGAPLTIPEIQSACIPVICSNACAGIENIKIGVSGYVFESNSKEDLIDKINKINTLNFEQYQSMRNKTREYALMNNSTLDDYINNLLNIVKSSQ